jgi:hypothetical protein
MKYCHRGFFVFLLWYSGLSAKNISFQEPFTAGNASTSGEVIGRLSIQKLEAACTAFLLFAN